MKQGEVINLGKHRLMCGDVTNPDDVAKLMQGFHAKILFTSPPYADLLEYNGCDTTIEQLIKFIPNTKDYVDAMCINLGITKKNFEIIQYWDKYISEAKSCNLKLLSWNVWDKTFPGSISQQRMMFPLRHEFIFVFGEKPYKLNRTIPKRNRPNRDKRSMRKRRQKNGTMKFTSANHQVHELNKQLETVVAIPSERGPIRSKHPAVMPVALPIEYIKAMTNEGDYVLDTFAGSGSTLIACERTNRKCLAMEISEKYCDVITERYFNETRQLNIWED